MAQPAGCVMPPVLAMQVFGLVVHEGVASRPRATTIMLIAMPWRVLGQSHTGMFHQRVHSHKHVKCHVMSVYGS